MEVMGELTIRELFDGMMEEIHGRFTLRQLRHGCMSALGWGGLECGMARRMVWHGRWHGQQ